MKQPRTSDFDPNANTKPLKSSMDSFPAIEKPGEITPVKTAVSETPPVLPVRPVRDINLTVNGKRKIKSRHPFDIYEDQAESLKQLSIEDRMQGGNGSMSAMVREAIDSYIDKKHGQ
jgi:hypothetical protein